MKTKEKKPGHFEIEAWGMLLFFALMLVVVFVVVKGLPYYWKYKAEKQQIQQETPQQQTSGKPDSTK